MRELVFECSQSKPPYPIRLAAMTMIHRIWLFLKNCPTKPFRGREFGLYACTAWAPVDKLPISIGTWAGTTLSERARNRIPHSVIIFKQTDKP
jgi:hypothetical protein